METVRELPGGGMRKLERSKVVPANPQGGGHILSGPPTLSPRLVSHTCPLIKSPLDSLTAQYHTHTHPHTLIHTHALGKFCIEVGNILNQSQILASAFHTVFLIIGKTLAISFYRLFCIFLVSHWFLMFSGGHSIKNFVQSTVRWYWPKLQFSNFNCGSILFNKSFTWLGPCGTNLLYCFKCGPRFCSTKISLVVRYCSAAPGTISAQCPPLLMFWFHQLKINNIIHI